MSSIVKILTTVFILIGIFLFLSRGRETVSIIRALSDFSLGGIVALQGR